MKLFDALGLPKDGGVGPQGPAGPAGAPGAPGTPGTPGSAGAAGPSGPAVFLSAKKGRDGWPAIPGVAGQNASALIQQRGATWTNGAQSVLVPATDVPIVVAEDCTIQDITILTEGGTGSCAIDIWKVQVTSYPPTVANTIISGSSYPAISSGVEYRDTTLSGLSTTALSKGDAVVFHLRSSSTFSLVTILLSLKRVGDTSASGYTDARAEDAVGGILSNSGNVGFTYTSHTSIVANVQVSTNKRVLGKTSGAPGSAAEITASALLDWIDATQGDILYRDAGGWAALGAGTAGQILKSGGPGANPSWVDVSALGGVELLAVLGVGASITTTVLADILSIALAANSTYSIIGHFDVAGLASNGGLDYQFAYSGTMPSSVDRGSWSSTVLSGPQGGSGTVNANLGLSAGKTAYTTLLTTDFTNPSQLTVIGWIETSTAGNLKFQAAQHSSSIAASVVMRGSYFRLVKLT